MGEEVVKEEGITGFHSIFLMYGNSTKADHKDGVSWQFIPVVFTTLQKIMNFINNKNKKFTI